MGSEMCIRDRFYVDAGLSVNLLTLGLPDRFEAHAKPEAMIARVGLDAAGIQKAIEKRLS